MSLTRTSNVAYASILSSLQVERNGACAGRAYGGQSAVETARILGAALGQATEVVMAHGAGNLGQALLAEFMADAGFNPEESIFLWQRVKDQPEFRVNGGMFSTHPSTEERLTELTELLPAAVERYRQARETAPGGGRDRRYATTKDHRPGENQRPTISDSDSKEFGDSFSFSKSRQY